jgi:hypothetical protein
MVDYSKWDKLAADASSEEDNPGPSVYRVEKGGSLNIPGRNVTIHSKPGAAEAEAKDIARVSDEKKRKSQAEELAKATRNGSHYDDYFWAQTGDTVTVAVDCPPATKVVFLLTHMFPTVASSHKLPRMADKAL